MSHILTTVVPSLSDATEQANQQIHTQPSINIDDRLHCKQPPAARFGGFAV